MPDMSMASVVLCAVDKILGWEAGAGLPPLCGPGRSQLLSGGGLPPAEMWGHYED